MVYGDSLIVPNDQGKIYKILSDGKILWERDIKKRIYGIAKTTSGIYLTSKGGLYTIEPQKGEVNNIYNINESDGFTPPSEGKDGSILFGAGEYLYAISKEGKLIWKIKVGKMWQIKPLYYKGVVYVGNLNNEFKAIDYSMGKEKWSFSTRSWVVSTPAVWGNYLIFGTMSGHLYALEMSGKMEYIKWRKKLGGGITGKINIKTIGSTPFAFISSKDRNLYAIELEKGEIFWSYPTKGWTTSPIIIGKNVIFGSTDGVVYSLSVSRACSILEPKTDTVIGEIPITIRGKGFSEFGNPVVQIRVNQKEWEKAEVDSEGNWEYLLIPSDLPADQPFDVECRVTDRFGTENWPYTKIMLIKSSDIPKEKMYVGYSPSVELEKEIRISIKNKMGDPIKIINYEIDGKEKKGENGTITLSFDTPGEKRIKISSPGYLDKEIKIYVKDPNEIYYYAVGFVLILVVIIIILKKFILI